MSPRFRTEALRVTPGEARTLLHALRVIRPTVQTAEPLDNLARRLADVLPHEDRPAALAYYRTEHQPTS